MKKITTTKIIAFASIFVTVLVVFTGLLTFISLIAWINQTGSFQPIYLFFFFAFSLLLSLRGKLSTRINTPVKESPKITSSSLTIENKYNNGWPREDVETFLKQSGQNLIAIDSAILLFSPFETLNDWGWQKGDLDFKYNERIDYGLSREVKEISNKYRKSHPDRKDSMKYCLSSLEANLDAGERMIINANRIRYLTSYPVAKLLQEELNCSDDRPVRKKIITGDLEKPFTPNMLIAHVAVITGDKKLLLTRRKNNLDYYRGCWSATFEEHYNAPWKDVLTSQNIHPDGIEADINDVIFSGIERGLREEMRLATEPVNEIKKTIIRVLGIGFEFDNLNTSIFAVAELPEHLTYEKMITRLKTSMEADRVNACEIEKDILLPSLTMGTQPTRLITPIPITQATWGWHPTSRMRIFLVLARKHGITHIFSSSGR